MNDVAAPRAPAALVDGEALIYRALVRTGLHRPLLPLLRSPVAWRLSGMSLATALFATSGSWGSEESYARSMRQRWQPYVEDIPAGSRAFDFGTGLGGNLLGLSGRLAEGVGLDINPFFVGHATRIARRAGAAQLRFFCYDGGRIPPLGTFDLAICTGAFERIPKPLTRAYVDQLAGIVHPRGRLFLYFLTARARAQGFGRLLGPDAYSFWDEDELRSMFEASHLTIERIERAFPNAGDTYLLRSAV